MRNLIKSFCVHTVENLNSLLPHQELLSKFKFTPCTASQEYSIGFSPLGIEDSDGVETIIPLGDRYEAGLIHTMTKSVPKSELNIELKEKQAQLESQGQILTKAQKAALKDSLYQTMLARAFPKRNEVYFILDKVNHCLFIGSVSVNVVESVLSLLRNVFPDAIFKPFDAKTNPSDILTDMVMDNLDSATEFEVGNKIIMEDLSDSKISWSETDLCSNQIVENMIKNGRYVTQAELKTVDEDLTFVLNEYLQFSSLKFSSDYLSNGHSIPATLLLLASKITEVFFNIVDLLDDEQEKED